MNLGWKYKNTDPTTLACSSYIFTLFVLKVFCSSETTTTVVFCPDEKFTFASRQRVHIGNKTHSGYIYCIVYLLRLVLRLKSHYLKIQ